MKAIVYTQYGPPDVLHVQEVGKPTPKDNEVLIRIRAAAVTPSDVSFRKADPFIIRFFNGLLRPKQTILGTEFSGDVEAVGKDVTRFGVGDQVFAATGTDFGAHAEYGCLPEDGALAAKPTNMTHAEASAICAAGLTALPFLRDKAKVQSGQRVLINGASGSVGSSAVQLAKYFGADVTGVCSTTNVELVRSLGADKVIDYTKEDFARTGQTYDVIFDTVGKSSFLRCKNSLTQHGVYLITVPTVANVLLVLWTSMIGSKKAVMAATGMRPPGEKAKDLLLLKELAEAGRLKPVMDRTYALEQIAEAHRYVETGHKKGNIAVILDSM